MSESGIGIIILAAGSSSRLGEPKQLLQFEGETLLSRAVRVALETPHRPVIVVLGAHAGRLREEIAETDACIIVNEEWAEGMGSSIRCGLLAMETRAVREVEAVILMLCDQPFVTSLTLNRLIDTFHERQALLVASEYEAAGETARGVPALFSRKLFPELLELRGAAGAKRLIMLHEGEADFIAVPEAAVDVDTLEDYRALQRERERTLSR